MIILIIVMIIIIIIIINIAVGDSDAGLRVSCTSALSLSLMWQKISLLGTYMDLFHTEGELNECRFKWSGYCLKQGDVWIGYVLLRPFALSMFQPLIGRAWNVSYNSRIECYGYWFFFLLHLCLEISYFLLFSLIHITFLSSRKNLSSYNFPLF